MKWIHHSVRKINGTTLCIVLHYGSQEDTVKCLDSLMSEDDVELVVSDNDPSQSFVVPDELVDVVKLFRTGGSSGFARGNNSAAEAYLREDHDSLLIINNDTVVLRGSIRILRETLAGEKVGLVGPCMPYMDAPEKIWACGGYINKVRLNIGGLKSCSQDKPFEVDYLPGAAILCRVDVWLQVNGLPERYFLAFEEAEFALEVKRLGFKVLVNPNAIVLHKVGMSGQTRPEYFYNKVRNRIFFAKYLYGDRLGLFIGVLVTSTSVLAGSLEPARARLSLWLRAVADDLYGRRLNRARLLEIADRYRTEL